LIVLGYEGEPYLRVGPDGVFRNSRSPATYLNTTRYGGVTVPPDADPNAPPNWVKIGSGRTVLWHDHRTHWMGGTLPISVRRSPSSFHTVFPWKIDLTEAGRPIEITGSLNWVPGSSSGPWLAGLVLLAAVGIVAGTTRRWAPAMLAFTALIVVADVLHAVGTGLAFAGSVGYRLLILGGSYYSVVAWALGVVAVRLLSRKSIDGLFAAVFTGLVIGLFGGLADVGSLWRSQVPFAWGTTFARVIVMVSIGGSVGLVVGAIVAFRRNRAKPGAEAEVEQAITPA
jgi:hypothetical protein